MIRRIAFLSSQNFELTYYRNSPASFPDLEQHVVALRQHLGLQRGFSASKTEERRPNLKGELLRTLLADGAYGHAQPIRDEMMDLLRILEKEKNIVRMKARIDAGEMVPDSNKLLQNYKILGKV